MIFPGVFMVFSIVLKFIAICTACLDGYIRYLNDMLLAGSRLFII